MLKKECRRTTRLSYLAADEVLIPAASYFESALCRSVVDELRPLYDFGCIYLVGGGIDLDEFFDDKQRQYHEKSPSHQIYYGPVPTGHPPFMSRRRSAHEGHHRALAATLEPWKGPRDIRRNRPSGPREA